MAMAIPAIVDPVGVNASLVDHGINGFICITLSEWEEVLENILKNPSILIPMKSHARQKIIESYSLDAHKNNFIDLFRS